MSKRLLSGHEVEKVSDEEQKELSLDVYLHGLVRIKPEGWLYPATAPKYLDRIHKMEVLQPSLRGTLKVICCFSHLV